MRASSLLLVCLAIFLAQDAMAQTQTPPPFPGWANKSGTSAGSPAPAGKELLGQWVGFVSEGDGSNPRQRMANITLTITDGHMNSSGAGTVGEGTYQIV